MSAQHAEGRVKQQSPYDVLGVSERASWKEITAAYRQKAQQYHPDKMAGLTPEFQLLAEERMKDLNVAYAELKRRHLAERQDVDQDADDQPNPSSDHPSPGTADAYFETGQHYLTQQRYEDAVETFIRVLRLRPDFTPAYLSLAVAYGSLHRRAEQIDALKQAVRLQPSLAWAHAFLGLAYVQVGDIEAASREYEILKTLDPALAEKLPPRVRTSHSSPLFSSVAVSPLPHSFGRWLPVALVSVLVIAIGLAWYVHQRHGEGGSSPKMAKAFSFVKLPSDPLAALGQQYVLEMIAHAETEGGALNEHTIGEVKNRIEGLSLGTRVNKERQTQADTLKGAGLEELFVGHFTEAIRIFQEAVRIAPGDSDILTNLGYAHLRNGDLVEAQRVLLQTLTLTPGRSQAWANLGQTYAHLGNQAASVACFAQAFRFSSDRAESRRLLRALADQGTAPVRDAATQALRLPFLQAESR
jgi:tetratricopeptide (TPR) repeat protein